MQFIVSIKNRKLYRDKTGDPWNGRTLEWSTASPVPVYNFAITPKVTTRDQFWEDKQNAKGKKLEKPVYEDIYLPKNSPFGLIIAGFAFLFAFGIIWHIWWLAIIGLLGAIISFIIRSMDDEPEYCITAEEVEKMDAKRSYA